MTNDYGKRICLECGKEFNATYLQQITCSPECLAKRKAKLRIIRDQRRYQCHKERLATLIAENNKLLSDNEALRHDLLLAREEATHAREELAKALEAVSAAQAATKEPEAADMEAARNAIKTGFKPQMQFCERMGVKAINLPCGKREECFNKPRCRRVPAGATNPVDI